MNKKLLNALIYSIPLFTSLSVNAMTVIAPSELPAEIQICINNGSCGVDALSIAQNDNANMLNLTSFDAGAITTSKLIRYSLESTSQQINNNSITDLNGFIWLQAADHYSLTDSMHDFTLYLDQVSPTPLDLSYGNTTNPSTINLSLTTTDLLTGSAFTSNVLDSNLPDGYSSTGSLFTDGLPPPCLADICGTDALLNLIYLQYYNDGLSLSLIPILNDDDSRDILYTQRSYYQGDEFSSTYQEQVYAVQAVPLAPSFWLFVSGLIGFSGFIKQKRK